MTQPAPRHEPEPVLVTGATGLLGRTLVAELLARGDHVTVLARGDVEVPGTRVVRGDLRDAAAVRAAVAGVRAVYHLAAVTRKWLPDRAVFQAVNVDATLALARAAGGAGVERFVHVSSFTVFGPSPDDGSAADEAHYAPAAALQNDYQRSKRRAHDALRQLAREEGVPAVLACPGVLFGPAPARFTNPVAELMAAQRARRLRAFPGGDKLWTLAYLPDVARGLIAMRARAAPGDVFVLGGDALSPRQLFEWVAVTAGVPLPRRLPLAPVLALGAVNELLARVTRRTPRATRAALRLLSRHWRFSSAKAGARLGYEVTPLATALAATWQGLGGPSFDTGN